MGFTFCKHSVRPATPDSDNPLEQVHFDERHIAREEKNRVVPRGGQGRVNPANRPQRREQITSNNADRPARPFGHQLYLGQHGVIAKSESGFATTHSLAKTSGENANLTCEWIKWFDCPSFSLAGAHR